MNRPVKKQSIRVVTFTGSDSLLKVAARDAQTECNAYLQTLGIQPADVISLTPQACTIPNEGTGAWCDYILTLVYSPWDDPVSDEVLEALKASDEAASRAADEATNAAWEDTAFRVHLIGDERHYVADERY